MPASSTSSSFGWAAYIASSFALCIALAPTLSALSNDSMTGGEIRITDGIAAVIDQLKPGVSATFSYSSPDSPENILLGGHSIRVSDGNGSIGQEVRWLMPVMTLAPGRVYTVTLLGDSVEVNSSGGS